MKKNYFTILLYSFSIILSSYVAADPVWLCTTTKPVINTTAFVPVMIYSFKATIVDGKDLLKWDVSVNPDLVQFQIESSTDNIHFYAIDSLYPKVVASDVASYEFYSPYLVTGTRYYRLKLIYNNGYTDYSYIVNLDDATSNRVVVLYNSTRQFQLETPYLLHTINVLNASGQILLRYTDVPAGSEIINMTNFAAGVYYIQCISNKNEVIKIMNG